MPPALVTVVHTQAGKVYRYTCYVNSRNNFMLTVHEIPRAALLIRPRHTSATLCGGRVVGCAGVVKVWQSPTLGPHHGCNNLQPNSGTTILTTQTVAFLVGLWCKCGGVATTCPEVKAQDRIA